MDNQVSCILHAEHEARIKAVEKNTEENSSAIAKIREELGAKTTELARLSIAIDNMMTSVGKMEGMLSGISSKLIDYVIDERKVDKKEDNKNNDFMRKMIWICLAVLLTIVAGAFSVKSILGGLLTEWVNN